MGVRGAVDEARLKVVVSGQAAEPHSALAVLRAPAGVRAAHEDAISDTAPGELRWERQGGDRWEVLQDALEEGARLGRERRSTLVVLTGAGFIGVRSEIVERDVRMYTSCRWQMASVSASVRTVSSNVRAVRKSFGAKVARRPCLWATLYITSRVYSRASAA